LPAPPRAAGLSQQTIRLIAPNPPAAALHLWRLIGQKLTDAFGQQVILDNRAGGNGLIVAKQWQSPRRCYTLEQVSVRITSRRS